MFLSLPPWYTKLSTIGILIHVIFGKKCNSHSRLLVFIVLVLSSLKQLLSLSSSSLSTLHPHPLWYHYCHNRCSFYYYSYLLARCRYVGGDNEPEIKAESVDVGDGVW